MGRFGVGESESPDEDVDVDGSPGRAPGRVSVSVEGPSTPAVDASLGTAPGRDPVTGVDRRGS